MFDRIAIRYKLILATSLLVLLACGLFGVISYRTLRQELLNGIDAKLYVAAHLAAQVPPPGYFDRIRDADSVTPEEYARIVDRNNRLCLALDLQYLWSCMLIGDPIVFTTSTSPSKDVTEGDHAGFFEVHRDPMAFEKVFRTMKPDYSSFHNEWGHGRMVLVPAVDSHGRRYCYGASMSVDEVHALLRENLNETVIMTASILAFGVILSILLSRSISKPVEKLTEVAEEISKGNLLQDVDVGGSAELRSLSNSIHEMSQSIRDTIVALEEEIAGRKKAKEELHQHREHLEEVVARRTEELARSNADLEQFASAAAHDLQEPLHLIIGFGDLLQSTAGHTLDEKAGEYLQHMLSGAQRMRQLIDDLLKYSRVTTREKAHEPVDLSKVAAGVVADLKRRIDESGGRVEVGPLPTLVAEPSHMRQLLQNLISNALKYRKKDVPPVVKVTGESFQDNGRRMCRLQVVDNGIGFKQEYAERIFGIFQRLHSQDEYDGTGVGLATCARIVQRHGGSISARSQPGEGATFTVELPCEKTDQD